MARIAIDMDHVIADAHKGLLDWLSKTYLLSHLCYQAKDLKMF